jgi:exopolysaccharide production protein ExoQ
LSTLSITTRLTFIEHFLAGLILLYFFGLNGAFPALAGLDNIISYIIVLFLISKKWKKILYIFTLDPLIILLVCLAITSILWSASPTNTSLEVRAALRSTLLGGYLAASYSPREFMNSIMTWVIASGIILSFLAAAVLPEMAISDGHWSGIFAYKNMLAYIMVIGVLLFANQLIFGKERRLISAFFLIGALLLVYFSQGKTSWACLFISLTLLPITYFTKASYKIRAAFFTMFVLIAGASIILAVDNLEFIVVEGLGKNLEFNGRVPMWQLMIEQGFKNFWLGYGYAGFWTSETGRFVIGQTWASGVLDSSGFRFNAHNAYIDTFLSLGFVGFSTYLLAIFLSTNRLLKLLASRHDSIAIFWMIQSLVSIILMSFADSFGGGISNSSFWTLFVYMSLSSALQKTILINRINTLMPSKI